MVEEGNASAGLVHEAVTEVAIIAPHTCGRDCVTMRESAIGMVRWRGHRITPSKKPKGRTSHWESVPIVDDKVQ